MRKYDKMFIYMIIFQCKPYRKRVGNNQMNSFTSMLIKFIIDKNMNIKMTCFESRNDGRGPYLCNIAVIENGGLSKLMTVYLSKRPFT